MPLETDVLIPVEVESPHPEAGEALQVIIADELIGMLEDHAVLQKTFDALRQPERLRQPLEKQIETAERIMGIRNPNDRLLEAGLFIDKLVLDYTVITGVHQPERTFGDAAWADHLDAAHYLQQANALPLEPELLLNVHKLSMQRTAPDKAGKIRLHKAEGGDMDDPIEPVTYTSEQVDAINQNPQLTFRPADESNPNGTTGYIVYPHRGMGIKTQKAIYDDIQAICSWYNQAEAALKPNDLEQQYLVAAELQQRIVSLHPFMDGNGGVSRLFMNWALAKHGIAPAVLADPNADLTTSTDAWALQLMEGSSRYERSKKRAEAQAEAGIEDAPGVQGVSQEQAFQEYIYHKVERPPFIPAGSPQSLALIKQYMDGFFNEIIVFAGDYMKDRAVASIESHTSSIPGVITEGGLITSEAMAFASSKQAQVAPGALAAELFEGPTIYRGAELDEGEPDDQTILSLFEGYTSTEVSYRANTKSLASPATPKPIAKSMVIDSMDYYNKMLAVNYLKNRFPKIKHYYTDGKHAVEEIGVSTKKHSSSPSRRNNSPFTSATFESPVARNFAYGSDSGWGVAIRARAPAYGSLLMFDELWQGQWRLSYDEETGPDFMHNVEFAYDHEREVLIPGAIQPASIDSASIYGRMSGLGRKLRYEATRVRYVGAEPTIDIKDLTGDNPVIRRYVLDRSTGKYALESSFSPVELPPYIPRVPQPRSAPEEFSLDEFGYGEPFEDGDETDY